MKFLEAKAQDGKQPTPNFPEAENKMLHGTRSDQRKLDPKDPQSLISGSKGSKSTPDATVKALAQELNVSLSSVKGTGPNGQITEQDVRSAAK